MNLSTLPLLSKERIFKILNSRLKDQKSLRDLPDPNSFKDMQKATKRVLDAIKRKEKIAVIGDYDVDGIVATTIMRKFFEKINYPIEWIIPNRFKDGYGISESVIKRLNSPDLIITVDNGISANNAILECNKRGIDVIITDHHIVPKDLPKAYAIINQKQLECNFPYDEVCGAQIAWYFCASLRRALSVNIDMKSFLELVALAIVADIMPLLHINRAMLKSGLRLLSQSTTPFVLAYKEFSKKNNFKADDIAFGLAPLLNSAGRVDDAFIACEFLFTKDLITAKKLLEILNNYNKKRKELESIATAEAISLADKSQEIIVISKENWHEGIVGIVASRVSREFEKPTIILTQKNDLLKGSGRSYGECNLFKVVESQKRFLVGFGGHSKAIGLALKKENLKDFTLLLQEEAKRICPKESYFDKAILGILSFEDIDFELFELIDNFEPFGHENKRPKFISLEVEILEVKALGDGEHFKYKFFQDGKILDAIHFRANTFFREKEKVNIIYSIDENLFNNTRSLQLLIEKIWI